MRYHSGERTVNVKTLICTVGLVRGCEITVRSSDCNRRGKKKKECVVIEADVVARSFAQFSLRDLAAEIIARVVSVTFLNFIRR